MKLLLFISIQFVGFLLNAQNFNSYFTGNPIDSLTLGKKGICLMGGATEHDNAMKWFLERANGGDVLVLRASGADGYNDYMFTDLGVNINSVETIVFNDISALSEVYIHNKIKTAEAIWFAGGDQWDYISFWRNTVIDSLINEGIENRNIAIGGTSAGMAIQGEYYFTAENGTISSTSALSNPFHTNITLSNIPFIENQFLINTITDTHFDNPDRKGRLITFLARIITDFNVDVKAIACDEYTAVCIDENGIAKSFGDYPNYDEDIYFIQSNCHISNNKPEICNQQNPLTWNLDSEALLVYNIKGTNSGSNSFDLNNWKSASGGEWKYWSVSSGILSEQDALNPECLTLSTIEAINDTFEIYQNENTLFLNNLSTNLKNISLIGIDGKKVLVLNDLKEKNVSINIQNIPFGIYTVDISGCNFHRTKRLIISK